jgi:hypothetical protein
MNLLEHYIIEVHDITEFTAVPGMIKVDVTYDCWGNVQRGTHITSKELWEEDLKRGYYLA